MSKTKETLAKIEIIATQIIVDQFSAKLLFHNIKHIQRIVETTKIIGEAEKLSDEDLDLVQMGAWLIHIGLSESEHFQTTDEPENFLIQCQKQGHIIIDRIFKENNLSLDVKEKLIKLMSEVSVLHKGEKSLPAKVLADARGIELSSKKGQKKLKKLYEQLLLMGGTALSPLGYFEMALNFLNGHKYETSYAQKFLSPKKEINRQAIEKAFKDAKKQKDSALKRELEISDMELKDLKKKLNASSGRDDRGIQTIFRTTSKNHYTLNEMVDRKASIMISVNSIILSIIIGGLISVENTLTQSSLIPIIIMIWASFLSIVFAVLSIRPETTHGVFSKDDIRNKKGNLLFFGNFHGMDFQDYEWGMLQMLSDQDYLYSTLVRDIYYLGKTLKRKYRTIRISLNIFMFGIGISFLSFFFLRICRDHLSLF